MLSVRSASHDSENKATFTNGRHNVEDVIPDRQLKLKPSSGHTPYHESYLHPRQFKNGNGISNERYFGKSGETGFEATSCSSIHDTDIKQANSNRRRSSILHEVAWQQLMQRVKSVDDGCETVPSKPRSNKQDMRELSSSDGRKDRRVRFSSTEDSIPTTVSFKEQHPRPSFPETPSCGSLQVGQHCDSQGLQTAKPTAVSALHDRPRSNTSPSFLSRAVRALSKSIPSAFS
jgi:hypothetical protein